MAFAASIVLAVAMLVGSSEGFGNGVRMTSPMDAFKSYCTTGNMRPGHGTMPQNTAPDFELIIPNNVNTYRFGTPVEVTLRAKAGKFFKGFFITGDGDISAAGLSGSYAPVGGASKKTKFCGVDGLTHTNKSPKTQVKVKWNPPREYHHGKVQFKATVVMDKNTFWTGVLSKSINPPAGVISQEEHMEIKRQEFMQQMQDQAAKFRRMGMPGMNGPGGRMPGAAGGAPGGMDFSSMLGGMDFSALLPGGGAQQSSPTGGAGSMFQRFATTG